ncbi:MerR family transcriptional regulator [Petrotoga olearia]|mgnify:CR=1 FL=1|uniref:MerR family transcriptional regulator n=2 Tax=Petrotoga olearia TaxID=156203 RepID=A0A2K1P5E5_9BACT|nr:MerR family transcriptional regulator [Petrotoga olearia]PNR98001.1 MerR family transcriptional regulator [Petrotoga olearia DSM 13574]RMA75584.1 DNA-binding transcriptional MerR regulator [Petrotoga olearia]
MYYTIGEIAKKVNVSPHTLRFYAKEGLLPFVERSESGIRMFKDEDFQWLMIIECLKKAGMPIKDIKTLIDLTMEGDSTIEQRLEIFKRQKESLEKQIAQLQETLKLLKYKCWYYETAKNAGTCAVHNTIKIEDIPEDIRPIKENIKKVRSLY